MKLRMKFLIAALVIAAYDFTGNAFALPLHHITTALAALGH